MTPTMPQAAICTADMPVSAQWPLPIAGILPAKGGETPYAGRKIGAATKKYGSFRSTDNPTLGANAVTNSQLSGTPGSSFNAERSSKDLWSYRCFSRIDQGDTEVQSHVRSMYERSTETHLLSFTRNHDIRICGDRLKIRKLSAQRADGLELWSNVVDTRFPLDAHAVDTLCEALDIRKLSHDRANTAGALVFDLLRLHKDVRVLTVLHERICFLIYDCVAEYEVVEIAGDKWRVLAVEHFSPDVVADVAHRLIGESWKNRSYPELLKNIVDHIGTPGYARVA